MVIDNLPFDKYELEPSPLTQYILHRRQPTVCWQVGGAVTFSYADTGVARSGSFVLCGVDT